MRIINGQISIIAGTLSLLNCHKLYIGIAIQIWFALSTNISLIFVVHAENGAQFLNATSVLSSAATVIFPVTKINPSE